MEKIYYLALYLIGINNKLLVDIILNVPKKEVKNILLKDDLLQFQYMYNINIEKYADKLLNKNIVKECIEKAENIVKLSKDYSIDIIAINNKRYPKILRDIDNPPALLHVKGKSITKSDQKAIACVGTRNATTFGISAVNMIVKPLTKEKFTIVSGLATGIDAESHRVCLANSGRTIAVLAHGLDQIYPKENTELAKKILENGGTLVSEYPIGTRIDKFRFVDRNRIIAGLSKGTVIFESKEKSGSMHTVNFALVNNRKVFCPVPTYKKESVLGLLQLINTKQAIPLYNQNDYRKILNTFGYKLNNNLEQTNKVKIECINTINQYNNQNSDLIKVLQNMQYDKYSTIKVNKEVSDIFKEILKDNNLTMKEFINGVIVNIVSNYNKGE
ncbi:DNA-processing protein DprA [Clostridium butyricum]|uniref:DNA-processing protein DprA n=1 Tax=Clostridium butyricum TaxID=1492 RepID=UPI0022E0B4F5|nr:DNA-processing protein DprA [Clostridium butyricum]MDI9208151.1 DNA-processing protein DprA [Clostridium butyricum]